ncbi:LutB/LldF family L-lactate oxidation iron-sulfur protein [Inmirania thermothiophila]|uniref:L-lactate dehydrogenase complex protein LldF n=1 Tax=Inmirania thermothiophila TaxID=1750597 RepID=A0A3N1YA77_9GAMM|nr:LutB/LldF family L-lactate oxidation iron-sulfur protein [Inmirania thermothiophila]ROR34297.1 L-lactate dehydrogenase complex protein LldF [Inmirania thermothiophila]
MRPACRDFRARAREALLDEGLREALARARGGFVAKRAAAVAALPEFEALRDAAVEVREHSLDHLAHYLERFEARVREAGGAVHWARDAAEARAIVLDLLHRAGARKVLKGKSMVSEEVALNEALEAAGHTVVETDLGEYIIQLAKEPPSHIIAPAVHKRRDEIADLFQRHHGLAERIEDVPGLVAEARRVLREHFLTADAGITGANLLVAETGSVVLVTNEGNGDLAATLPRLHIVITGIEKVVPTLADAGVLLRLLARSATGQELSNYTTLFTGARRAADPDGPEAFHVVLVDNGRSRMLEGPFRAMLRCIRCGACLNHCPVYTAVGGHAYGWVYPGPMGSVLTPLMLGVGEAADLPAASTLCGRCEAVCPVRIPLPALLRRLRERTRAAGLARAGERWGLALWALAARRPALYRRLADLAGRLLARRARGRGALSRLPLARAWCAHRDLPAPAPESFVTQWRRRGGAG